MNPQPPLFSLEELAPLEAEPKAEAEAPADAFGTIVSYYAHWETWFGAITYKGKPFHDDFFDTEAEARAWVEEELPTFFDGTRPPWTPTLDWRHLPKDDPRLAGASA